MHSRRIIGTAVSITDYVGVGAAIDEAVTTGARIYICCAPASTLVFARGNDELASALADADIVTPDGMGVVHAARLLGESINERVYGPDLMALTLANSQVGHFLFGGFDDAALSALQREIASRFPGAAIAGAHSPPHRDLTAAEADAVADEINASGAKIVWVGIGSPKQEVWMQAFRDRLDAPVLIGVGAAFDFFAGRVSQAPRWMQRASLEWLYRLLQDPARLGPRYLTTLPRFAFLTLVQAARERLVR